VAVVRGAVEAAPDAPVLRDGAPVAQEDLPEVIAQSFATVTQNLKDQAAGAQGSLAAVLGAAAQIAADPALVAKSKANLGKGLAPVEAIDSAVDEFVKLFTQLGGMMAERVTDLKSVRDRVIAELLEQPVPGVPVLSEPSIIVAEDLAPADTAALDLSKVLAIVTELGGPTGHTAIIAGQLGLPCLVQVRGVLDVDEGTVVAVDAATGRVTVDPNEELRVAIAAKAELERQLESDSEPGSTKDGHTIDLLANIGTAADAKRAAAYTDGHVVAGSGLFRTEVLFLDSSNAPSVEAQAKEYRAVLEAFEGRKVVVRTLDAGADKPLAFATQPDEENPALGVRGYRSARLHPQLLEDQLEALAQAARDTGSFPWVMAPMIATVTEARDFAAAARRHGLSKVGVMIEVPAAALRARQILAEVDFVSIGSNDLAQYTMATDRLRGELSDLLDAWQPAILDLIAATATAGQESGKPIGVCGESASDPLMALVLTGLGVTSLSMSAGAVPAVRFALRHHTLEQCRQMAQAVLAAATPQEAKNAVVELLVPEVRAALVS
jgi:phosphotransferase system enzyme I (PtsI)